jgi:hypothetical protein
MALNPPINPKRAEEPVAKWVSKGNRMPIGINQQGGLAYYHLNPTEEGPHGQSFP